MISACIVIRHEEKLLPRCLKSIEDIVDEVILVHDGPCKDKSIQIAKEFGAKVFIRLFVGEAERHRPFSFGKAKGNWILQIDADEFLSDCAREKIPELVESKEYDGYSFLWPYPDKRGYIKRGPFAKTYKPCLFRKEKMYMIGISHEYPRTYGKNNDQQNILLLHKPEYDNFTFKAFKTKWVNWAKLQAKQIRDIKDAPVFNVSYSQAKRVYDYYKYMVKRPVLSGISETLKFVIIYLSRGLFFSGRRSFKIAVLELAYIWLIRINLLKLKHESRK